MKTLVIDRYNWDAGLACGRLLHGRDWAQPGHSLAGASCCLGHLGIYLGAPPDNLRMASKQFPSGAPNTCAWPSVLFDGSHREGLSWEQLLGVINDTTRLPREPGGIREQWIATGFEILFGIKVEFVGEYREVA